MWNAARESMLRLVTKVVPPWASWSRITSASQWQSVFSIPAASNGLPGKCAASSTNEKPDQLGSSSPKYLRPFCGLPPCQCLLAGEIDAVSAVQEVPQCLQASNDVGSVDGPQEMVVDDQSV